ncbi:MAG: S-layer homology domain-containing protein [Candidatus Abawacabacteria bacterium]|nr:S-layer homology domain-containing protein [Candidatus Abawacabacteria bacterium]
MKKYIALFITTLLVAFQLSWPVQAASFSDLATIHPDLSSAVIVLAGEGIIHGYGDGTYRPQATISEQEWARLVLRAKGLPESVSIYSQSPITRINALRLMSNLWQVSFSNATSNFSDISTEDQSMVAYFEQRLVIKGRSAGLFLPQGTLTRAEAAKILLLARNIILAPTADSSVRISQNVVEIIDVSPMSLAPSGTGSLIFTIRNHGDPLSGLVNNNDYHVSVLEGGVIIASVSELGNGLYQVLFRAPSYVPAGSINIQIIAMVGSVYRTDIKEFLQKKNAARVDSARISLAQLIPNSISSGEEAQILITPQDGRGRPVSGLDIVAEVTRGSGDIVDPVVETPLGSGVYVGKYLARGQSGSQIEITVRINNLASRPQTVITGTVR